MTVPISVSGREFTRADDETAPPVAVVNEVMVAQYWRGEDPVGRRLQVKDKWMRVVGVAKVSNYSKLMETPRPFFYVALKQNPFVNAGLNIRTTQSTATMATAVAREIHALDSELAPTEMITMREQVDRMTASQKIAVTLLTIFGGVALLLAAIGLYGVMSYSVSQSTRELGLRLALGASGSDLLRLVMSHGMASREVTADSCLPCTFASLIALLPCLAATGLPRSISRRRSVLLRSSVPGQQKTSWPQGHRRLRANALWRSLQVRSRFSMR